MDVIDHGHWPCRCEPGLTASPAPRIYASVKRFLFTVIQGLNPSLTHACPLFAGLWSCHQLLVQSPAPNSFLHTINDALCSPCAWETAHAVKPSHSLSDPFSPAVLLHALNPSDSFSGIHLSSAHSFTFACPNATQPSSLSLSAKSSRKSCMSHKLAVALPTDSGLYLKAARPYLQ